MNQPKKFATTRWSLVVAAAKAPSADARAALATLCGLYWYPLYAFVRRNGASADEAAELTQAFFVQLLEKNDLSSVDPNRGRFRSWLLACLKHFQANERVRARAEKRGGGLAGFSIDANDAEGRYQVEPSHQLTADKLYERRWLLSLLERAHEQLRAECAAEGERKLEVFEVLKGALMGDVREVVAIAQQAKQQGLTLMLLGGDGWDSEKLFETGGAWIDGAFITNHYSADDPSVQGFVRAYQDAFGFVPDARAALGYDAARLAVDAMRRAPELSGPALRAALSQTRDFDAVTGRLSIDAERNAVKPAVVLAVEKGRFRFIKAERP